jgi:predicted ATPase/DNA-binding winged helix-turn-helix (wHTH) protein
MTATIYTFGPFRLDAQAQILFRGSEPIALGRRAVTLLRVLVERPGAPISKDALIEAAWSGLAVEDSNLTVQIGALRRALALEPGGNDWIETLPRRGYRFKGPPIRSSTELDQSQVNLAGKPRNNLPIPLTSFIGRAAAIEETRRLFAANRFLTLVGIGGAGKTRLAINVGVELRDDFADGVWLVELAGLSDPALVPQAVASAIGAPEQHDRPVLDSVIAFLRTKSLLLILDNCEHLLASCAELARLALAMSSSVRILATSRESLGIDGEVVFRVPPLTMPKADGALSPQALLAFESPRLFLERAVCVQRKFEATDVNAFDIARICQRLDGLPLAIELAAAQTKVLSVSQICQRLEDQISLLDGRNRPTRHQTLEAVIDWSYQLLTEAERAILRRLSVFAGGGTLQAAEAICCGDGVGKHDVLDLMARLVDKSLVIAETLGSEARYNLLETVRHYGQRKLAEGQEADATQKAHLQYFVALAEKAEVLFRGASVVEWAERIAAENDNMRAALQWSLTGGGDVGVGLRLAGAMAFFWRMRGHVNEGSRWLAELMSRAPEGVYFARAKAYSGAGLLAWWKGATREATEFIEKALSIFRELGDTWWIARSLQALAFHNFALAEYDRAAGLAEEALALADQLNDKYVTGYSLALKAILAERAGDDARATAWFDECIDVRRKIHHKFGIASALRGLGRLALRHGDYNKAVHCYRESLMLARECGDASNAAPSVEGLAALAVAQGERQRAGLLLGAAEGLRETIKVPPLSWERGSYESCLQALAATVSDEDLNSWRAEGRAMTIEQVVAFCL